MENAAARRAPFLLARPGARDIVVAMKAHSPEHGHKQPIGLDSREAMLPAENDSDSIDRAPVVYVAACGALCDVFWWARPKVRRSSECEGR